jgi:hypothetical protein
MFNERAEILYYGEVVGYEVLRRKDRKIKMVGA